MHLKRIDIQGFKSFAEKTPIEFNSGITAIVGPNGSGKSNVADAVRWVMGEQNARMLRGMKMEDVIFAGTKQRPPMGYCEVCLTFDNEDGSLPLPYTEVCVARRLYRSGESEYSINRKPCRMKDITMAFYDTGIGRDGYSIIGQGRIEEILSPKSEERRIAFEEAAGVTKYKMRKLEAERKLKNVQESMLRVSDIMAELESSLQPLEQEAALAREYLSLREQLKQLDIGIFVEQYRRNQQRVDKIDGESQELEITFQQAQAKESAMKQEIALQNEQLSVVDRILGHAREKQVDLTATAGKASGNQEVLLERKEAYSREQERLRTELEANEKLLEDVAQTLLAMQKNDFRTVETLEEEVCAMQAERDAISERVLEAERESDEAKQAQLVAIANEGERKSQLARQRAIAEQAQARYAQVDELYQQLKAQVQELQQEWEQAQEQRSRQAQLAQTLVRQSEEIHKQISEQKQKLAAAEQQKQQLEHQSAQAFHRLTVQKELKRSMEGYAQSVRRLMEDIHLGGGLAEGVYGPIGELIKTDREYEHAIEQALGGSAQNIVVRDESVAKRLIGHLRNKEYGRATFLPLHALKPRELDRTEKDRLRSYPGVVGCAMELVKYPQEVSVAIAYLLGRTVVVQDMDAGIAVSKKEGYRFRCVTLAGDLINAGGTFTGGSVRERGIFSRDRLIAQAEQELKNLQQESQKAEETFRTYQIALQQLELQEQKTTEQLQEMRVTDAQQKEKREAIDAQLKKAMEEEQRYSIEMERLKQVSLPVEQEQGAELAKLQIEVDRKTNRAKEMRLELKSAEDRLMSKQLQLSALKSETAAAQNEQMRLEAEQRRLENALISDREQYNKVQSDLSACEQQLHELQENAATVQSQLQENQDAIQKLCLEKERLEVQVRALGAERETILQAQEENRERRYRLGTQKERVLAETDAMETRLWRDYQLTYAQASDLAEDMPPIKPQAATTQANALRNRIAEMGEINPKAIEEYARVRERYDFLSSQSEDLTVAKNDLTQLIADLMAEMQARFIEQFHRINENFKRTFSALFRGGEAELRLADESRAMECDIEISASPPGKQLQRISLLSGGERALTAIAILFAILELKATPFCILDEIETALDEENLRRFADYLKEYSKKTQFIAITHRRATMEAASDMYGVTMQERGVSKLMSVHLADVSDQGGR